MNKILMNRRLILFGLSILVVIFLTSQTCQFGAISTGLAADCAGEGDIVCDDTEAYQCQLATYGTGYYVSRAPAYDVDICGAVEEEVEEEIEEKDILCGDGTCDEYETAHDACPLDCAVAVDEGGVSITDVPVETVDVCVDEDEQDYYTLGTTAGTDEDVTTEYEDTCTDETTLSEYYCDGNVVALELFSCGAGYSCLAGACQGYTLSIDEIADIGFSDDDNEFEYSITIDNRGPVDAYDVGVSCVLDVVEQGGTSLHSDNLELEVIETIAADDNGGATCTFDLTLLRDYLSSSTLQEGEEFLATVTVSVTDSEGAKEDSLETIWVYGTDITAEEAATTAECTEKREADDCDGYSCKSDGTCYETCTFINQLRGTQIGCAKGYQCTFGGTCVAETECTTDEDCSGGYACKSDGTCYETCGSLTVKLKEIEYGCAENYECSDGECVEEEATWVPSSDVSDENYTVTEEEEESTATATATITYDEDFITNYATDDYLLFQLEDFTDSTRVGDEFTVLTEESSNKLTATQLNYVSYVTGDSIFTFRGGRYYFDLAHVYTTGEIEYAMWASDDVLEPSQWIIVQADVRVESGAEDEHSVIFTKQIQNKCGYPLYSLTTRDSKYRFIISIDGVKYTLASTTAVGGDEWMELIGVYTGDEIQLYVNGELEDSETVSGTIRRIGTAGPLVFGYSTVCGDFNLKGYIDNIYIWGE